VTLQSYNSGASVVCQLYCRSVTVSGVPATQSQNGVNSSAPIRRATTDAPKTMDESHLQSLNPTPEGAQPHSS
jgi:hypothetical protein